MTYKKYQLNLLEEDIEKLDEIGVNLERSRSFLLRKAIKKFLEESKNAI